MSNGELFWLFKNGVRLSGIPGFAKIEDDEQTQRGGQLAPAR